MAIGEEDHIQGNLYKVESLEQQQGLAEHPLEHHPVVVIQITLLTMIETMLITQLKNLILIILSMTSGVQVELI